MCRRFVNNFILVVMVGASASSSHGNGTTDRWYSVSGPQLASVQECVGPYVVQLRNSAGQIATTTASTPVGLATNGSARFFSDATCTLEVSQVAMGAGASQIQFYLQVPRAGRVHLVTKEALGAAHGGIDVTVRAKPFAVVTGQPGPGSRAQPEGALNSPRSVFSGEGRYVVADSTFHRVLIWSSQPTTFGPAPAIAVGQPNLASDTANSGGLSAKTLSNPSDAILAGSKLIVADQGNHRVLIYNSIPTAHFSPADVVLGQRVFNEAHVNASGVSASSLNGPRALCVIGTKLVVADTGNHRVLIWNTIPTQSFQPADIVLGQSGFSASSGNAGGAVSDRSFLSPVGLSCSALRLYVADASNNRVLGFEPWPTSHFEPAAVVLGQPTMTSATANNAGITSNRRLSNPSDVEWDGASLWIADQNNHRVLRWAGHPASTDTANLVLGQPNFNSGLGFNNPSASQGLRSPLGLSSRGPGQIMIADQFNHRILGWTSSPPADGDSADFALGQLNLTDVSNFGTSPITGAVLRSATSIAVQGSQVFVTDQVNHRVLIYNSIPGNSGISADVVVGQTGSTTGLLNSNGTTTVGTVGFNLPTAALVVGGQLVVSDAINHRVAIFAGIPSAHGTSFSHVVGQSATNLGIANQGGRAANRLSMPMGLATDGTRLLIADRANCRVLIYNSLPGGNNASADRVLGQADGATANCVAARNRLNTPNGVATDGTRIAVADSGNGRVVIWNSYPTVDGADADVYLGKSNWTTGANRGPAYDFWNPSGVYFHSGKLIVADTGNNRVLVWTSIPTVSDTLPSYVLGMESFATRTSGRLADLTRMLTGPTGVWAVGSRLWIVDSGNQRIVEAVLP